MEQSFRDVAQEKTKAECVQKLDVDPEINIKLSYDFWRKPQYLGKQLINKQNKIYELALLDSEISELNGNENEVYDKKQQLSLKKEIVNLRAELKSLNQQMETVSNQKNELQLKVEQYKKVLFSLMYASIYTDDNFFQILNGRPIENDIIRNLFDVHFKEERDMESTFLEFIRDNNKKNYQIESLKNSKEGRITDLINSRLK